MSSDPGFQGTAPQPQYPGAVPQAGPQYPGAVPQAGPQYPGAVPQAGPPSFPSPALVKRKRIWLRILLGILGVIVAGLLVSYLVVGRTILAQWPAKVSAPDQLAGLTKSTDPQLAQLAAGMAADMNKSVGVHTAVGAIYANDPMHPVVFGALSHLTLSPANQLHDAFKDQSSAEIKLEPATKVDAGKLGGSIECGNGSLDAGGGQKVPLVYCGWADFGSVGIAIFINSSDEPTDAATFLQMRAGSLKR